MYLNFLRDFIQYIVIYYARTTFARERGFKTKLNRIEGSNEQIFVKFTARRRAVWRRLTGREKNNDLEEKKER